jgi:tetratricopeptide (TPR) repeat protein
MVEALVPAFDLSLTLHQAWDPPDSAGVRALAALLVSGGAAEIAAAHLAARSARFPEDAAIWVARAWAVVAQESGGTGMDAAGMDPRPATARIVQLLWEWNRLDDAIPVLDRAISLVPGDAALLITRGLLLLAAGRAGESLADFAAVLAADPDHAAALRGKGLALVQLDRLAEAREALRNAAARAPDDPSVLGAQAHVSLALGDYAAGWRKYETRWSNPSFALSRPDYAQPLWLGEDDLAGRTILLHGEQGFGDIIQFCRYTRLVARRAGRVLLRVPGPLVRLMRGIAGIEVLDQADPVPAFDCYCPLMSLPLAFGTSVATIPAEIPYLGADPGLVEGWRRRLRTVQGPLIGVVWAGNARIVDRATNSYDRRRSIPAEVFGRLLGEPAFTFVSLQKDLPGTRANPARNPVDWTSELVDFADTAALIEALDLVITVDTAVAHLAGALGKPVWILNRHDACWRWVRGVDGSPWYPTARLFRQPAPGDWDRVISDVATALTTWSR